MFFFIKVFSTISDFFCQVYLLVFGKWVGEEQRERERERIPSRLCIVSTEPDAGLELTNCEIVTWAQIKGLMLKPTEPARCSSNISDSDPVVPSKFLMWVALKPTLYVYISLFYLPFMLYLPQNFKSSSLSTHPDWDTINITLYKFKVYNMMI